MDDVNQTMPFSLQEGETMVESIKPPWSGYMKKNVLGSFIGFLIVVGYLSFGFILQSVVVGLIIAIVIALVLSYIFAVVSYGKYHYWITNMRVIGSRGFISYSTDSMPLEMVADVVVRRGIIDRLLGLSSIFLMPIGGAGSMSNSRKRGLGGTNYLQALTEQDAMRVQKEILDLRNTVKKEQKGSMF